MNLINFVNLIDGPKRIELLDKDYNLFSEYPCIDNAFNEWVEETISTIKGMKEEIERRATEREEASKQVNKMIEDCKENRKTAIIYVETHCKKSIARNYTRKGPSSQKKINSQVKSGIKAIQLKQTALENRYPDKELLRKVKASGDLLKKIIEDKFAEVWRRESARRCGIEWDDEVVE